MAVLLNFAQANGDELDYLENKLPDLEEQVNPEEAEEFDRAWQAHLEMTEIAGEVHERQKLIDFYSEQKNKLAEDETTILKRIDELSPLANEISEAKINHLSLPDHDKDDINLKLAIMLAIELKVELNAIRDQIKKKYEIMKKLGEEVQNLHESKEKYISIIKNTTKNNNRRLIAKVYDMKPENLPSRPDDNFKKDQDKRQLALSQGHCGCSYNSGCNCHVPIFYECLCTWGICCEDYDWAFCSGLAKVGYCLPAMY